MSFVRNPLLLAVLIYQSIFLALGQIWNNKLRSILTTIGIVIGVASVTAVIAALTGLKTSVLSEFESFGTNKIFIFPSRPDRGPMRNASFQLIRFRPELFDHMLENCPSVKTFTRVTTLSETIAFNDRREENIPVTGIESSWHEVENRFVTIGRPFSMLDNERARAVCIINQQLQDKLGLARDPTGQYITIAGRQFLVVGVIESRAESSMFRDNLSGSEVFIPFTTAWQLNNARTRFPFMSVVAASRSPEVSAEAKAEILFYLRKQRQIGPGDLDTFRVEAVDQFVQQFKAVAAGITAVATGVVAVSLIVGGVGIMNIMLVSVSERTREIGLRKAVGARPGAVLMQFLIEAITLCLIGGLIGLVTGQLLTTALASIPAANLSQAYIPAWAIALSFGFAASVGLIFGMFPAIKAARLDPIDALRHE
jgi:putative ABC transport system permease protein